MLTLEEFEAQLAQFAAIRRVRPLTDDESMRVEVLIAAELRAIRAISNGFANTINRLKKDTPGG